jgi:hypothetical protein
MTTTCPICNRPVDPLRARAVGVRDGKVVGYCSAECAAKADVPATPTRGGSGRVQTPMPAVDSAPVIEILHEPASGVVTSARDERVPTGPVPKVEPEVEPAVATAPTRRSSPVVEAVVAAAAEADTTDDSGLLDASGKPRPPGKRTIRRRRDSLDAKAGWEWLDDEPAENVRPGKRLDTELTGGKGRGISITLLVLALLGGGGYLAYRYLYLDQTATSVAPKPGGLVPGSVEPVAADAAPVKVPGADPAVALDRAREVLRGYLKSKSGRVQRDAAEALGRTGDPEAIAVLSAALAEAKPTGKLELAYALARAGDKRGTDVLVAALGSANRDDRLTAGRLLAQLGDRRAVAIASYLDVTQNRLSVAEQLARLSEPMSIKALQEIRIDPKSASDAKARATIALGLAGKTEVTADLHALVNDPHFNVTAAEALAMLHDNAARPVLEQLLQRPTLRVGAARGLRRLDPNLDSTPYLPALLAALGKVSDPDKKDTEQIEVAEAILLVAGTSKWSEPL